MKYVKISIFIAVIFIILCVINGKRIFITSPSGKKTITIFRPVSLFWKSDFYIIPYRYDKFNLPNNNYVIISPKGVCSLDINWAPNDGHKLKMAFSSGYVENTLSDSVKMSQNGHFEQYLDKDEKYWYPKYESYSFSDLLNR